MDSVISKKFYDPETGFLSATKLYKKLKPTHPNITLNQIKKYVDKQFTTQLNRPSKKPKAYSSIFSPMPKNNYQIDIMVYDRYEYNNYKYILCVIDVYSRYASARALTNRGMTTIMNNIKDIFNEMGTPNNINCDNEFNKKAFNTFTDSLDIKVYYSEPNEINKNAIVERFNLTLATMLQKWRTATGKYDWKKILPKILSNYNHTYHSTIKDTPFNLFNGLAPTNQIRKIVEHHFKVGDKVRKKLLKKVFDKNDVITYSKTIYIIRKVNKNKLYLTDSTTGEELPETYKPYQLKLINEIQYIDSDKEDEEQRQHEITQRKRKINKQHKQEGIDESNRREGLRERKPKSQLEHKRFGNILW